MAFTFPADSNGNVGAVTAIRSNNDFVVPLLDIIGLQYQLTTGLLAANATWTGATIDRLAGGMLESRVRIYAESNAASAASGLVVEESHDGTTWATSGTATSVAANTMADTGWRNLARRYWRVRYVNGATAQTRFALYETRDTVVDDAVITGSATVSGTVTAAQTAATSLRMALGAATTLGSTPLQVTGLSTTPVVVKGSAGMLYSLQVYNPTAAVAFVQVHNATSAAGVTLGTTVPLQSYAVAAGAAEDIDVPATGITFGTGIVIAATTTSRGATAPATGLEVSLSYA